MPDSRRHVLIILKWCLHLTSVTNAGGISLDVRAMTPDFSSQRSTHASACGHTAKTSALGWLDLRLLHHSLIVQSIDVFRFPRRLRPRCLSLSQRTVHSVSFIQALLDRLPEILAALGNLRLCSHPLERMVMIVAS